MMEREDCCLGMFFGILVHDSYEVGFLNLLGFCFVLPARQSVLGDWFAVLGSKLFRESFRTYICLEYCIHSCICLFFLFVSGNVTEGVEWEEEENCGAAMHKTQSIYCLCRELQFQLSEKDFAWRLIRCWYVCCNSLLNHELWMMNVLLLFLLSCAGCRDVLWHDFLFRYFIVVERMCKLLM